jgi:hypothetical protein
MERRGPRGGSLHVRDVVLSVVVALVLLALALAAAQRSRLLSLERRADEDRAVVG